MTRPALLSLLVLSLLGCGDAGKTAPEIVAVSYAPMQLPVGLQGKVTGDVSFRDHDGNLAEIVLGFVDPAGVLSEATPFPTGTAGLLVGSVPFSLSFTPTVTGIYKLSLRLVDGAGLSSAPALNPITVN